MKLIKRSMAGWALLLSQAVAEGRMITVEESTLRKDQSFLRKGEMSCVIPWVEYSCTSPYINNFSKNKTPNPNRSNT